jgi:hypothetical protein
MKACKCWYSTPNGTKIMWEGEVWFLGSHQPSTGLRYIRSKEHGVSYASQGMIHRAICDSDKYHYAISADGPVPQIPKVPKPDGAWD